MQILPTSSDSIESAIKVIHSGGVVAHATETCYGLACDLRNEDAVKKVFELKKRPEGMPLSALFASVDAAKEWVEWNEVADELAEKYLPGPLTIVLSLRDSRLKKQDPRARESCVLCPVSHSLGIRISPHPVAIKLTELAGVPLSTTSANAHGGPNPYSVEDIVNQGLEPDLILDSGKLPEAEPSTVVKIMDGTIQIIRQGSISIPNPQSLIPNP